MNLRICINCKQEKPLSDFPLDKKCREGRRGQCKPCLTKRKRESERRRGYRYARKPNIATRKTRDTDYRRKYGITHDDYDKMLSEQNNQCALCPNPPHRCVSGRLVVDHCHTSRVVRGLLCSECNRILARFGDNVAGISKVLAYISKGA